MGTENKENESLNESLEDFENSKIENNLKKEIFQRKVGKLLEPNLKLSLVPSSKK